MTHKRDSDDDDGDDDAVEAAGEEEEEDDEAYAASSAQPTGARRTHSPFWETDLAYAVTTWKKEEQRGKKKVLQLVRPGERAGCAPPRRVS